MNKIVFTDLVGKIRDAKRRPTAALAQRAPDILSPPLFRSSDAPTRTILLVLEAATEPA